MNDYAQTLCNAAIAALPQWVRRSVESVAAASGVVLDGTARQAAASAGTAAQEAIGERLRLLLETDVDAQRSSPLAVLRAAVPYPTAVLRALNVPPVDRHDFEVRQFPDDIYGLTPATWADISESLYEPGITWGAWKAKTVLDRRRAEGRM